MPPAMPATPDFEATEPVTATGRWQRRLARVERLINRRTASPKARNWLLAFAFVLFVVICVTSFRGLPDGVHFRWWVLLILVFGTSPLTALCNAAEYRVMGKMGRHRIGWLDSSRLVILATAANLLPLPGGIVIRTQALRNRGSSYKRAFAANVVAFIIWLGVGLLAIGVLFLGSTSTLLAAVLLVLAGVVTLIGTALLLRRIDPQRWTNLLSSFVVVEILTVLVGGLRIFLAFKLIGLSASPAQAVALTGSFIIAAAVGILPGGLGIRELIAGGVGAAVSLSATESVAATASDRVAAQLGLALLALAVFALGRFGHQGEAVAETADSPVADNTEVTGAAAAPDPAPAPVASNSLE